MCTCASCSYTDSFHRKGFDAWPRGEPAGKRSSESSYRAHVAYSRQWGRGYDGVMHEPREVAVTPYSGPRSEPARLLIPKARWASPTYHSKREWIEAPTTMPEYIAQFERLNGLKRQEPVKAPARPATPGKAPQHFPDVNRHAETGAKIYEMSKEKAKRPVGRPPIEGGVKRVLVSLDRASIERARKLGGDNVSAGIRKALASKA